MIENEKEPEKAKQIKKEKPGPKPKPKFSIKVWATKNQVAICIVLTVLGYGWGWMQNNDIQKKLEASEKRATEAEKNAIHRTETAFAIGITGLKQTAKDLENAMIEQRTQNILLVEHCKTHNCQLPVQLAKVKDLPKYTPIAETYFGIQEIMIEKSKEGY